MEWWVPCKSGTCVSPSYRENSVPFLTGRHKTNCLCACLNHKNVLAESECLGIFASTTHSGMNRKNRSSYRRSTRQPRTFSSISKMYFLHSFFLNRASLKYFFSHSSALYVIENVSYSFKFGKE